MQSISDFSDASSSGEHIVFLHANGFPPGTYTSFLTAISPLGRISTIEHRPLWAAEAPNFLDWGVYANDAIKTPLDSASVASKQELPEITDKDVEEFYS